MGWRRVAWLAMGGVIFLGASFAFQQHEHTWRELPAFEYNTFPVPADYQEKTEFVFARLMYPNAEGGGFGRFGGRRFGGDWREGGRGIFWTMDYPRSDRHLASAIRRLSRIHVRSVEQTINLDEGDQWDWPWMYAVEVGHWQLTDSQVKGLREYLERGGFLMCDDFHGDAEWEVFAAGLSRVFPNRPIVEIPNDDQIFHSLYDLDDRYQVPGAHYVYDHMTSEHGGTVPHWRGIYDDRGRLMVAICFNMDLGDSWEHADNPEYPQQFSALGIRIALNYVMYGLTH